MKEKLDMLNFTKIKNFCSAKDSVKKMKKCATDCEKIFVKHIFGKGLLSKIQKEFLKFNSKKTTH